MNMAVTIKQIAAVAGVSRGTVDRVLHNRGGVNPEVQKHIERIAENLGYFPNRAGKMLAARKQPITIGCVMPSIGNLFFEDIKEGLRTAEAEMQDFGVSVKLKEIRGFNVEDHIAAIREMVAEGCNALALSTLDVPEIRRCVNELVDEGIPVISVNTDLSETKRLCYIGCDYIVSGRTAAGLLLLCKNPGMPNVLIATGSYKVKGHSDRIKGFNEVFLKRKLAYHLVDVFETEDDDERGYRLAKEKLQAHPEINCVYITAAGVSGVCRAVEELGIKRRKEIRVICFDDMAPIRKYIKKGIIDFSICQQPNTQGYQSVKKLFDYFVDNKKRKMTDYITKAVIKIKENMNDL